MGFQPRRTSFQEKDIGQEIEENFRANQQEVVRNFQNKDKFFNSAKRELDMCSLDVSSVIRRNGITEI